MSFELITLHFTLSFTLGYESDCEVPCI